MGITGMNEDSNYDLEIDGPEGSTQVLSLSSSEEGAESPFSPQVTALLKVISDFMFVLSRDGTVLQFQSCRHADYQIPPETTVGRKVSDLLPEDLATIAMAKIEAAFTTGSTQSFSCHYMLPGGFSEFDIRISVWGDGEVVAIAKDVTERRMLHEKLLEISQRERTRIGQDIHDGLGQQLTGISFLSKALHNKLRAQGLPEAEQAVEIGRQVVETISQTRNLARGMFPVEVDAHGLEAALSELVKTAEERFHIHCRLEMDTSVVVEDEDDATHLFRLAQEAISNSVKHGKASVVTVSLQPGQDGGGFVLSITDNGSGFETPSEQRNGLGLRIMKYRAQKVGGHLEVGATDSGGTVVRCICLSGEHPTDG